jgi:hypothetical protein
MATLEGLQQHCEYMKYVWLKCGSNSDEFARVLNGLWEILDELGAPKGHFTRSLKGLIWGKE